MKWLSAVAMILALMQPTHAQDGCAAVVEFVDALTESGAKLTVVGGFVDGGTLQIWVNDQTREWVALTVEPNGRACFRASGKGFGYIPRPNA